MKYKLKDIGKVVTGCTPKTKNEEYYSNKDYLFIGPTDIKSCKYVRKTEKYISNIAYREYSSRFINKNSVMVDCIGSDMGNVALSISEVLTNQQINSITEIDENKFNVEYIFYVLSTMKKYFHQIGTNGSTMPIINKTMFEEIEIEIPEKNIQNKIVSILSKMDKKIELNNKINDNLLELIKTLYIEKIKNNNDISFEEKTLDEFCNIFTGKKNANASEENGQYKFFTCAPVPLSINSYIYDGPAVIVAGNGAYTGRTNFYKGKFDLYQRTYGITTNNDYIYLFYAMIYTDLQNNIMGGTHGSAIPYIVMNDIAKFKVKYNKELFDELSQEIKVLLLKIKSNEAQNETLTQLRDTLLPKLMNGEIDLDNVEI